MSVFIFSSCCIMFVCFITKSFLTYSFVLPTPTLSTICRPLSSYTCSITPETVNVSSSYSHMRGPGVDCWLSDRSNCSHWSFEAAVLPINPKFTLTSETYPYISLYYINWSLYNYAAHTADILTPTTVVQGVDNYSWGLYCRRCYCISICYNIIVKYMCIYNLRIRHFNKWNANVLFCSLFLNWGIFKLLFVL